MLGLNYMAWLAILVWGIVPLLAWLMARVIRRRAQSTVMRGMGVVAGLAIVLAPWVISSGVKSYYDGQVRELCARDGGGRVYEAVRLPAERFDKWGNVNIPNKRYAKVADEYYFESEDQYVRQGNPKIVRTTTRIIRRDDGKILGESVRYARSGGDLPGPWVGSSFECPHIASAEGKLESSIFQRD